MSKWIAWVAGSVALFVLLPAFAADSAPPAAASCAACHGDRGQGGSGGTYPRLAGQPAAYLEKQLHDFKSGARNNRIMSAMAAGLSDRQITAVARYYANLDTPYPARKPIDAAALRHGEALVRHGKWANHVPACEDCHGPVLTGLAPDFPALAGQDGSYLAAELEEWRHGRRRNDPLGLMHNVATGLDDGDVKAVAAYLAWLRPEGDNRINSSVKETAATAESAPARSGFEPPPESAIPAGPDGDMIRWGEKVFTRTGRYAETYVGNVLTCENCHLNRGRLANSAPMWAAFGAYPHYRKKNDRVNTLADRIQGCFTFSMNGQPPAPDSKVMVSLESYFHWLATGAPVNAKMPGAGYPELAKPARTPDPARGAQVFKTHCALCHGAAGQGRRSAGQYVFPPLWGPHSFNWGAGMHRIPTAAAFIKANMPYGIGGSLTDQQAWDVAAFVDHHPRPQDPRFTGDVAETKAKYHQHMDYYGEIKPHKEKKHD
ncbi:MAG TPA: c-type cytochrome [Gammaproteobacteria bacterium]|nr:c-type cytochrome [Gammaproteobacteria bacterium]